MNRSFAVGVLATHMLAAGAFFAVGRDLGHAEGAERGYSSALHEVQFEASWKYLSCLSDHCEVEYEQWRAMRAIVDELRAKRSGRGQP